jgi:hypothetical protein
MHGMVERKEDHGGADSEGLRAHGAGRGDDEPRRQELVLVLMMLTEEAGIEADGFGSAIVSSIERPRFSRRGELAVEE